MYAVNEFYVDDGVKRPICRSILVTVLDQVYLLNDNIECGKK